jgi:hypothetical protein
MLVIEFSSTSNQQAHVRRRGHTNSLSAASNRKGFPVIFPLPLVRLKTKSQRAFKYTEIVGVCVCVRERERGREREGEGEKPDLLGLPIAIKTSLWSVEHTHQPIMTFIQVREWEKREREREIESM